MTRTQGEPNARRVVALLLALALGSALALVTAPHWFAFIPTHTERIGVGLAALRDPSLPPSVAVLGSSVAMAGIDGGQLEPALPGQPRVLHLASAGQSLLESYLFYDALPDAIGAVVLMLAPDAGAPTATTSQRINNFVMSGYRARPAALRTIASAYGDEIAGLLAASAVEQRFRARWVFQQWADVAARRWLRKDVLHERVANDLIFPAPFAGSLPRHDREQRIAVRVAAVEQHDLGLPSADLLVLDELVRSSGAAGRRVVLVLPPEHPKVLAAASPGALRMIHAQLARLARAPHVATVDASRLLRDPHFYDEVHPTREGARRLTREVARALAGIP